MELLEICEIGSLTTAKYLMRKFPSTRKEGKCLGGKLMNQTKTTGLEEAFKSQAGQLILRLICLILYYVFKS